MKKQPRFIELCGESQKFEVVISGFDHKPLVTWQIIAAILRDRLPERIQVDVREIE